MNEMSCSCEVGSFARLVSSSLCQNVVNVVDFRKAATQCQSRFFGQHLIAKTGAQCGPVQYSQKLPKFVMPVKQKWVSVQEVVGDVRRMGS